MRRLSLLILCAVGLAIPQAAVADDYVGAPETHGPDSLAINQGPTEAPPSGGPVGHLVAPGTYMSGANVRSLLPTEWCGTERFTDDTTDELNNGTYKYHAVYMIPADARDRFRSLANDMQRDAFEASGLLERLYGRAIRYDMGTNCGPQYLDISVVRMQQTTAQLNAEAGSEDGIFDSIQNALDNAGFPTIQSYDTYDQAAQLTKNYIVWYDGPSPGGTCGQAMIYDDPSRADDNLNNLGGKLAAVYRDPGTSGFCDSNTVRHEIGHTLGALQKVAPHAFDGMHCDDAAEDTMCYPDVSPQRAGGPFFDYGNDDYWDPPGGNPLPWWTVDLNRFLCPNATCNIVPGAVSAPLEGASNPSPCAHAVRRRHPGRAAHARGCSRSHVSLRVLRRRRSSWRVEVRAGGQGRAIVALRCRRRVGGQVDTVKVWTVRLPRRLRMSVSCVTQPRAIAFVRDGDSWSSGASSPPSDSE